MPTCSVFHSLNQLLLSVAACTLCCGLTLLAPLLVIFVMITALTRPLQAGQSACILDSLRASLVPRQQLPGVPPHLPPWSAGLSVAQAVAGLGAAFPAVMRCRHVWGSTFRTAPAPVHCCRLARRILCCPDVQMYAWKQVQDGPRHRAIFSDPSEWPSNKGLYHGLYDCYFVLHNTLTFICEGTAGFKEMKVRSGPLQLICSCTNPVT